jgi:hypothetical protein
MPGASNECVGSVLHDDVGVASEYSQKSVPLNIFLVKSVPLNIFLVKSPPLNIFLVESLDKRLLNS